MSHRGEVFAGILESAEERLRRLTGIGDDHAILFLAGGASHQFALTPLNFYRPDRPINLVHTGYWTLRAAQEIEKVGKLKIIASGEPQGFRELPFLMSEMIDAESSYLYYCSNNTIYGTQWSHFAQRKPVPCIVDMSSDFLSRSMSFDDFDLIFACAQKNVSIAGMTIVVIRKDFAKTASKEIPKIFRYQSHIDAHGLFHTPPTFSIYIADLVFEWLESLGGLSAIEAINQTKSKLLYDYLDSSDFYDAVAAAESRSKMNVLLRIQGGDESLERRFLDEAERANLVGLKGHRQTGGIRVSLYNAIPVEAVSRLIEFMKYFAQKS